MNETNRWPGKTRIKPKFNIQKLPELPNGWYNFGEYQEATEHVSFEYFGEPNFAELNFNLRNTIGGVSHVKYMFHHGAIFLDNAELLIELNLRHVCISSSKCIFLCDASMLFSNVIHPIKEDDIEDDDFDFNIIIEFENKNELDKILKRLAKAQSIPVWEITPADDLKDIFESALGWEQLGKVDLKYYRTLKFNKYNNEEHLSLYADKKKRNFSSSASLAIMSEVLDYIICFDSQYINKVTHIISGDEQTKDYSGFYRDSKGNAFYIENVLLMEDLILIFGRVKIDFSKNEYDYYKCCFSFKSTNSSFEMISQFLNINHQSYWNLQEIVLENFDL
jgi:hypothetical protein